VSVPLWRPSPALANIRIFRFFVLARPAIDHTRHITTVMQNPGTVQRARRGVPGGHPWPDAPRIVRTSEKATGTLTGLLEACRNFGPWKGLRNCPGSKCHMPQGICKSPVRAGPLSALVRRHTRPLSALVRPVATDLPTLSALARYLQRAQVTLSSGRRPHLTYRRPMQSDPSVLSTSGHSPEFYPYPDIGYARAGKYRISGY